MHTRIAQEPAHKDKKLTSSMGPIGPMGPMGQGPDYGFRILSSTVTASIPAVWGNMSKS